MTNFEYYQDEILKIAEKNSLIGLINGKPISCKDTYCIRCDWYDTECRKDCFNWLYAEHVEKPKLTKRERLFCEFIEYGWITISVCDEIIWTSNKPSKINGRWQAWGGKNLNLTHKFDLKFDFIKLEDKEPWSVEDLLKLEVIEEKTNEK